MSFEQENGAAAPAVISEPVALAGPGAIQPRYESNHGVFKGRFGLRAGWGILIYVLIFLLVSFLLGTALLAATGKLKPMIEQRKQAAIAKKNHLPPPVVPKPKTADFAPKVALISEGLQFAAIAFAAWVLAKIERRRMADYGIGRYRLHDFLPGAFWGLASLSVLVGILRAGHFLVFDSRALYGSAVVIFGAKWMLVFLLVGLFEEYLMRGYLQFTLSRGFFGLAERISPTNPRAVTFWIAAFIMSVLFACAHLGNGGENKMGITMVFAAGIVFSYALWRTGSLWWAIGFHMAWDWAQSFLWGVPDSGNVSVGRLFFTHPVGKPLLSGGPDGPEGSVFVLPILLLVMVVIRFTSPGVQPPFEPETPSVEALPEGEPALT